jgi:hypothetical protein
LHELDPGRVLDIDLRLFRVVHPRRLRRAEPLRDHHRATVKRGHTHAVSTRLGNGDHVDQGSGRRSDYRQLIHP